jgi:hypothetical protein
MEVSGRLHVPAALSSGKRPQYPLEMLLGGPQSCSGCCGEEKNLDPAWSEMRGQKVRSVRDRIGWVRSEVRVVRSGRIGRGRSEDRWSCEVRGGLAFWMRSEVRGREGPIN